ncbi:hypothetical protein [Fodinicola acaciae]|uniref:hypothetical protein n=1 Tax=Fodinicola acaciae TaxID=2681555 RepID=UPI0013D34914|nr:hypothetical protein [Fodinicola acaciae]
MNVASFTLIAGPLAVALASSGFQKYLAWVARHNGTARWSRDDYLFWHDWVGGGIITALVLLWREAGDGSVTQNQILDLAFMGFGVAGLIHAVKSWGYESTAPHRLRAWRGIILPNVAAIVVTSVSVLVGLHALI